MDHKKSQSFCLVMMTIKFQKKSKTDNGTKNTFSYDLKTHKNLKTPWVFWCFVLDAFKFQQIKKKKKKKDLAINKMNIVIWSS